MQISYLNKKIPSSLSGFKFSIVSLSQIALKCLKISKWLCLIWIWFIHKYHQVCHNIINIISLLQMQIITSYANCYKSYKCKHKNLFRQFTEAVTRGVLWKKVLLQISQNSQESTCAYNFIKKEILAQMFFCEFCEITKNTLFT